MVLDLHVPVILGRLEAGRQGDGDEAVEAAEGRRCIEEDHRRSANVAGVGDGQNRVGFVDHLKHSVQGDMRVGTMPPVQAYGVARSMPSLQGAFWSGANSVYQGGRS